MAEYTEDLCEGGIATASYYTDYYGGVRTPDAAFDNITGSKYTNFWDTYQSGQDACWLMYDFGEGNEKRIEKYTILLDGQMVVYGPRNWIFKGSNDNVTWTNLDTQVEQEWTSGVQNSYIFSNSNSYRYYKLDIVNSGAVNRTIIDEVEMMEKIITEINPNRPDLVNKLYNTKKTRLRGKAKEGFVRPTISQFFTSRLPRWSPVHSFTPPTIGEFVEGGYYFGTIEVSGTTYYLVCADKASGEDTSLLWGDQGTLIGSNSTVDGYQNTVDLEAGTKPAADFCRNLTIGGYNDWYLPAKDELNLLYQNHSILEAAGDGGFAFFTYWSSTEYNANFAWYQKFGNGDQDIAFKGATYYVRAIRRFAA